MSTTRANIDGTGSVLQTWLDRTVLENFEPELRFYDMGKKPVWKSGYNTLAWTRVRRITNAPADVLLSEGVTPSAQSIVTDTITVTALQYGEYATITDMLEDVSPIPIIKDTTKVLSQDMARIIDTVIQENLSTNGTNVIYGGTAANRAALASGDLMTPQLMAKANAFLAAKAAPTIGTMGAYVGIMHSNVIYDLQVSTSAGSFIELKKYTDNQVSEIMKGEIGMMFGVRIVRSAHIQSFTSTVTVYPTYIMGEGAYGVANLDNLKTYITPKGATDSDPLNQRRKVGLKIAFNSIILQDDGLVRVETASGLSYSFGS